MNVRKVNSSFAAFLHSLQLPSDLVKGNARVYMEGNDSVCIENFKGICSCTSCQIKLYIRNSLLCITGQNLKIECYTKDEIEISGCISRIEYK